MERAGTREEKTMSDRATKVAQNTEEMTIVNSGRRGDKLTQNMKKIRDVGTIDIKIDKTPDVARCVDVNHRPVGNPRGRYDDHSSKFFLQ
jgi:acetolactate synthase regulatory subunit